MRIFPWLSAVLCFFGLCALPCVATARSRPAAANGQQLYVLFDRGLADKNPNQCNQLNQVSEFMEPDLIRQLNRAGYTVSRIAARGDFKAEAGASLLVVKTMNYNPGSTAARIVVGFGAGSASLDFRYELYGDADKPFWVRDHGRGSSRDWRKI